MPAECVHPEIVWLVDELGDMSADKDGYVSAPVTKSHLECTVCGQHVRDVH